MLSQDSVPSGDGTLITQHNDLMTMLTPSNLVLNDQTLLLIEQLGVYYASVESLGHQDALLLACQRKLI